MLVKFTIEPDALSEAKYYHISNLLQNHWSPYGILVFKISILDKATLNCDHNVRDLLKESYKHFRSNGYPLWLESNSIDWKNMDTPDDLARYHAKFELALIEETRALEFGVPEHETNYCGSVEAAKLPDVSVSNEFKTARQLANSNIPIDQPIADLWAERFQMLAKVSELVTIVDRYAVRNLDNGQKDLLNLFQFLESDSSKCYVTIYSSPDVGRNPVDLDQITEKLKNKVSKLGLKKIKKITLHMSLNHVFSTYAHDRYIRFDGITCAIGKGIEVFRYKKTNANSTFAFKSSQFIHEGRNTEQALRDDKTGTSRLALHNGSWELLPTP